MNCPNCGAPVELVESRRYFQCRHCGTFHFPDAVEADGIRIVGPASNALRCPVCKEALGAAVLDDDHPIHFCARCRGILLPRATFAGVIGKRRAWATNPPAEPRPLDRQALERELNCPRCNRRFDTYPHYGPGNAVIDGCATCDLIWLDYAEMQELVDAPGQDRGARHVPRTDDAYIRQGRRGDEEFRPPRAPLTALFRLLDDD